MALPAPKSAYIDLLVKIGTTEADAKLTELAIANVDEATLKSRFYLDKTLSGIYNGVYVFIGGCIVGSDNYYMHNLNRIGSAKGTQIGNVVYFADAGLNTLGLAHSVTATSRFEVGGVEFNGIYNPAWYVAGTADVRFKDVATQTYSSWLLVQNIPSKESIGGILFDAGSRFWNLIDIFPNYAVGKTYVVEIRFKNQEGVLNVIQAEGTVIIKPYLVKLRRGASVVQAFNSTQLYDVYPNQRVIDIGTIFYEDENMQSVLQGGFHMLPDDGVWYQIDHNGIVTSKGYYNPYSDLVYQGSVTRNNTSGSKFGSYDAQMYIGNNGTTTQVSDDTRVVIGTLKAGQTVINEQNINETFATHYFPAVSINASGVSNRFQSDNIDMEFNYGTWVYIVYKGAQQIGADYII